MPAAAAAAQIVGGGLKIWGDNQQRKAEHAAYEAQRDAVRALKGIDVGRTEKMIARKDMEHYRRSLEFFRQEHPELAKARDQAVQELTKTIEGAREFFDAQEQLFKTQVAEATRPDPLVDEIRKTVLEQTQANLRRGAQLPPEFQAELVKAGLETDVSGSRQGTLAQRTGRLLGMAGLELEAQRRHEAGMALQLDQALKAARQGILGNLVSTASRLPAEQAQFFGTAQQTIDQMTPSIGLKGADVFALEEANRQLENEKKMMLGNLKAQDYLSMGRRDVSMINRGAEMLNVGGSMLGNMGGGGGGGMFSGMMGGNQVVSSPQFGTVSAPMSGGPASINRNWWQQANFNRAQARYE